MSILSPIETLLLLLSLGVFAAILLLVVFAIINKRPVLAVLAAAIIFLVIPVAAIVVSLFAYQSHEVDIAATEIGSPPIGIEQHHSDGKALRNVAIGATKGIALSWLLLAAALPVIGIIAIVRWLKSRNAACAENGDRRSSPAFAIVLIAIVLLGGFRFRMANDAAAEAQRRAAEVQRDRERTARERTRERVRVPSPSVNLQSNAELKAAMKQLSAEQRQVALQLTEAQRQVAKYIDNTDIHELMDKFDAPRIFLTPSSSSSGPMVSIPTSVLLPFQLIKQIATSTPEAPATPESPAIPESLTLTAQPAIPLAPAVPIAVLTPPAVAAVEPAKPRLTEAANHSQNVEEPLNTLITDPKQTVDASTGRPNWISAPSETVGGRWIQVIVAGDYVTEEECQTETNKKIHEATNEYIKQFAAASSPNIQFQDPLAIMGLGTDYLRREVAKAQYVETVERSVGPMKKLYTRMEISPAVDRELHNRWNAYLRQFRMGAVGLWAASILGVVSLALGLLKIDTVTKGYYTKLLFIGVPVAIIGFMFLMLLVVA